MTTVSGWITATLLPLCAFHPARTPRLPCADCDAQYHMYLSDMTGGCGLNVWATGSRILHAKAPQPMGPFTPVGGAGFDIALPPEAHNPALIYTPDDQILLFHIGNGTTNRLPPLVRH
jgi:hypothetical protein